MTVLRTVLTCLCVLSAACFLSAQTTRNVPAQFATIQAAINASQNGDTVLVAPGTYVQNINFSGKAITVRSSGGAAVTTIMGNGTARVVSFVTIETAAATLEGFTITGGNGGIICARTSPTIKDCIINGNLAVSSGGGAVKIISDVMGATAAPSFTNCKFTNNLALGMSTSFAVAGAAGGGAVIAEAISGGSIAPSFLQCSFRSNSASNGTGGAVRLYNYSSNIAPPGIWSGSFIQCDFEQNWTDMSGGAIYAYAVQSVVVNRCRMVANTSNGSGCAEIVAGSAVFSNCLIAKNVSQGSYFGTVTAGQLSSIVTTLNIQSSTIVDNIGGAASVYVPGSTTLTVTINSCIICGAPAPAIVSYFTTPAVTHSLIETGPYGFIGTNISGNPRFVDRISGDYHLSATSPCVNTGNVGTMPAPATDLDGGARLVGQIDKGADEFPPQQFPGTNEDFDLYGSINGLGDPLASTIPAPAGSLLLVRMRSPGQTLAGAEPVLAGQIYPTGMPLLGPMGFPEIHVNLYGGFVVYGQPSSGLFTVPGIGSGIDLVFNVPFGLAGLTLRLQAIGITPMAANGLFATSAARDVVL